MSAPRGKRVALTMTAMQLARVERVDVARLSPGASARLLGTRDWSLNVIIEHGLQAIEAQARATREGQRAAFEADAEPYGFNLARSPAGRISPEPWAEYSDDDTGHRWGGWLAARGIA